MQTAHDPVTEETPQRDRVQRIFLTLYVCGNRCELLDCKLVFLFSNEYVL